MSQPPHRLSVRVVSRALVATAGSTVLLFLMLVSEPLEQGESAALYYSVAIAAGLTVAAGYEITSRLLTVALSKVFGRASTGVELPGRPSVLTVRGGLLMLVAYFGGMLVAVFFAALALAVPAAMAGGSTEIDPVQFAWIMPLGMVAGALCCLLLLRRRATRRDFVVFRRWAKTPDLSVSLLTVAGGVAVGVAASLVLPLVVPIAEGFEPGVLAKMSSNEGWPRIMFAVIAIALAPPIEEFVFRGVLLEGVLRSSGRMAAVGVTAVVFTAVHLPDMWGYWPGVITISLGAVALAELRLRTGSLLTPMIGHASYNTALVALAAVMSA